MSTRTFALIFGIVFLAVGILGFGVIPQLLKDSGGTGTDAHGMLLGYFHVNFWHNLVHILFGIWGVAASRSASGAVMYARAVAIIYALLAIMGLIEATRHGFGYVELGDNNVYLHAALAAVAAFFGFVNRPANA